MTVEEEEEEVVVYRFDKGFLKTLLLMGIFTLFALVPAVGPLILFTIAPFTAGYYGGKYVPKKDALLIGVLVGVIWSLTQFYLFFFVILEEFGFLGEVDFSGTQERSLLALVFGCNVFFCALGGWKGGVRL